MTIFVCEDTWEGILTGVYDAWYSRLGHEYVKVKTGEQLAMELFAEYVTVVTDMDKASRLEHAIRQKISDEACMYLQNACLTEDSDKADLVYRFLVTGFRMGAKVIHHHADDAVRRIFELRRSVMNELNYTIEFIRFMELQKNLLFSKISPKCDVVELAGYHFQDRLPEESWAIYDMRRNKACIHEANQPMHMLWDTELLVDVKRFMSEGEEAFQNWWKTFFRTIAIKERINPKLQTQLARKRFQKNMLEFDD